MLGGATVNKVADERPDHRPRGDFLRRGALRGAEHAVGLVVSAPLVVRACGIDEQARLALGDGDHARVDPACQIDRGPGVAERDSDVNPVKRDIDTAERRTAEVGVGADLARGGFRFVEQVERSAAAIVQRRCYGPAQEQRAVHRPRFRGGC